MDPDCTVSDVVALDSVVAIRGGKRVIDDLTWRVRPGEQWVVLGPNGSGKTTLSKILAGYRHPSLGQASLLGSQLGQVDLRRLRKRIGFVSDETAEILDLQRTALEVVISGKHATAFVHSADAYDDSDRGRARALLMRLGCSHLTARPLAAMSHGERQRVLLARALMPSPRLLVLDEPLSGLDVSGREQFLAGLDRQLASVDGPTAVMMTHHLEEIPPSTTHALLLGADGRSRGGHVTDVLTAAALTECFSYPLHLEVHGGRYRAWSAEPPGGLP